MPVTDQDARALAYLVGRIRQDTRGANEWDAAGVYAVIARMVGQSLPVTVERVTRHAADPEAKTPGALTRPFLPPAPEGGPWTPAKPADECPAHPGQYPHNCRPCASEALVDGKRPPVPPRPPRRPDPATHKAGVDRLRDQIKPTTTY